MKKIFVLLFGMLISTIIYAQEKNALVIKLNNGSTNTFILSEKPIVTVPDSNVVVTGAASVTYTRSEVEKFYFDYVEPVPERIESLGKGNIAVYYVDGENVRITGLKDNTSVSVASLDGKLVSSPQSDGNGSVLISLRNQSKGVYVLSFGGRSVKIRK